MLFYTRAFLCIGTIVVLAEGVQPAAWWRNSTDVARTAVPAAIGSLATLCRTRPGDCAAIARGAQTLAASPAEQHPDKARMRSPTQPRQGAAKPVELSSGPSIPR